MQFKHTATAIVKAEKKIAAFMGYYTQEDSPYYFKKKGKAITQYHTMPVNAVNFYGDWNAIMPVVSKINKVRGTKTDPMGKDPNWKKGVAIMLLVRRYTGFVDMRNTFIAILDFIAWYQPEKKVTHG